MDHDASFGNWLTLRRKALRLSRVELAQRIGCAVITLRKIEADERRPSRQIAERLFGHLALAATEHGAFLRAARGHLVVDLLPLPDLVTPQTDAHFSDQLPLPSTTLIGRRHERGAIQTRLLDPNIRLLTLLGAPGIGKTRLAIVMAHDLRDSFPDGVVLILLAELSTPDLVISTIARTLGIVEHASHPVIVQLQQTLRTRKMLLILDNFEHVLEAAPALASLLTATQHLKILATSRVALRLSAEQRFEVPPLELPPHGLLGRETKSGKTWQALTHYEAVALFAQRAQAVLPHFELHANNAGIVTEICRRLDGLPLAIELAAARSTLLTPHEILTHLDQRFAILSGGSVDLPMRQRTLWQAIGWSYDLLERDAQILFQRLAVFAGGWTVAAARAVCDADALGINIVDGLAALIDTSLIVRQAHADDQLRFGMLETIRAFAIEKLAEAGEFYQIQLRHLSYYIALVEQANPELHGPYQRLWLLRLRQDQSNLRAAFHFSMEQDSADFGLRLARALEVFWFFQGDHGEGYQLTTALLANSRVTWTAEQRAQALNIAGSMAWQHGDYRAARAPLEESVAIYRRLDDKRHLTDVLNTLGKARLFQGEHAEACALLDENIILSKALGDMNSLPRALQARAYVALYQANHSEARFYHEQWLTIAQSANDTWGIAQALNDLGDVARCEGDYEGAARLYQESLTRFRAADIPIEIAAILHNLGYVALACGDQPLAQRYFAESLELQQERNNLPGILESLTGFGALMADYGQPRRAAALFGAINAIRSAIDAPMWPAEQVEFDRHFQKVAAMLTPSELQQALDEGHKLTIEEATTYGLPQA